MTTYSDAITIVHRLKVWIADERMGDGALLKAAADLIERQAAELAALRAQLADAERKIERLKFHAEAMLAILDKYWLNNEDAAIRRAYRAEVKEES